MKNKIIGMLFLSNILMYLAGNNNIAKIIDVKEIVDFEYILFGLGLIFMGLTIKPILKMFYEIDIITQFFKISKEKKVKLDINNFSIEGFRFVINGLAEEAKKIKEISKQLEFIETQKKERDYLTKTAENDPLTGLYNRRKFQEIADEAFKIAKLTDNDLSIIMCDIDHFKIVNDTHGHDVGDDIIKEFVDLITEVVSDSGVVARWGGEEFIILIEDDAEQSAIIAEAIRERAATHVFPVVKRKTASFGVSNIIPKKDPNLSEIIKRADDALYISKENGRNKVSIK